MLLLQLLRDSWHVQQPAAAMPGSASNIEFTPDHAAVALLLPMPNLTVCRDSSIVCVLPVQQRLEIIL